MKKNTPLSSPLAVVSDVSDTGATQAFRDEKERLRVEVAYLKNCMPQSG